MIQLIVLLDKTMHGFVVVINCVRLVLNVMMYVDLMRFATAKIHYQWNPLMTYHQVSMHTKHYNFRSAPPYDLYSQNIFYS